MCLERPQIISAKVFKKLLKERGLTQEEVASRLGHAPSWLSRKITGARHMKCEELLMICKITGIPPHVLLQWTGPETLAAGKEEEVVKEIAAERTEDIDRAIVILQKARARKV